MRISNWSSDVCSSDLLAYAKFGWETLTRQLVRHEAEALDDLAGLTKGTLLRVPRVLFSGAWRGLEVIVLDPLVGQRLWLRSVSDMPVEVAIALADLRPRSFAELRSEEHTSDLQALIRNSYA